MLERSFMGSMRSITTTLSTERKVWYWTVCGKIQELSEALHTKLTKPVFLRWQ